MKEGWKMVKLGEVCESRLGKTLNSSTDIGKPYEYLCAVNIQWDKIDLSILKTTLFSNEEVEKFKIQKGDLLVCEGGEAGRAAIWDDEKTILYQNALHRIRFKNNVMLPRFCMHYLRKLKFEGIIDKNYARGATIKHLVTKSLYSIPIPLPPLEEQHRIVSILDAAFAKIDALKKNAEENLKNAKALFQQVLAQELKPKEGWKMVKLGEVCEVIAGQSPDSKYYNKTGVGIPFYQGKKEFTDKYIGAPTTWTTMETKIAEENDILMSVRAPVGDVNFAIERICIGRGLAAIRPSKMLNKDYLYYYLVCEKVNIKGKEGAVFPSINRNEIRAIEIPLPPLEEQYRIVRTLDTLSDKCRRLEQIAQQTIRECDALKQSILRRAFSGEL